MIDVLTNTENGYQVPKWYAPNYPRTAEITADLGPVAESVVINALMLKPYRSQLRSFRQIMTDKSFSDLAEGPRKNYFGDFNGYLSYEYLLHHYLPTVMKDFAILSPHQVRATINYVEARDPNVKRNEIPPPDGLVLDLSGMLPRWAMTCEYTAQIELMRSEQRRLKKQRQLERNANAHAIKQIPLADLFKGKRLSKLNRQERELAKLPIVTTTFNPEEHSSLLVLPRFDDISRRDEMPIFPNTVVEPLPFTFNTVSNLSDAVLQDILDLPMVKCRDTKRIEEELQQPIDEVLRTLIVEQGHDLAAVGEELAVSYVFLKTWMNRLDIQTSV